MSRGRRASVTVQRGHRHLRTIGMVGALIGAMLLAPVAVVAQTLDDLEILEDRVDDLEGQLDDAAGRVEAVRSAIEVTRDELAELERVAGQLERDVDAAEEQLVDRARAAFMRGGAHELELMLAADGPQAAVEQVAMLASLQQRDQVRIESSTAARTQLDTTEQLIEARRDELEELESVLAEEEAALQEELGTATEEADELRALTSRQQRIDRGDQEGIYSCIFDPGTFRFRDTWGHPRSGGRSHRGTDVFARQREPVFAFTGGEIQRHSQSRLGGIGLYLRGDDGNVYYYAHLDEIHEDATVGTRVEAGELVAYNGYTGNASRSAPHVHFELHPGGGSAIHPYPGLAAACY